MSSLRDRVDDYLRMRRTLGYKLESAGLHLNSFISYLEAIGAETVTIENAVAWATSAGTDPSYWAQRLSVVRQFTRHLQTIDPACEVPPARLLPYRAPRAIPYLYEPEEIAALMDAADALQPPLLAANYQTLIGLLSVTGLRLGETIRLNRSDLDTRHQLLRILDSKFGKSREVALHETTIDALAEYARLRDRRFPQPRCEALLVSLRGTRLRKNCIHDMFARLVRTAGLEPRSPGCRPRLHDFRHGFAVRTLLEWYRDGVDVQARLPLLSTHMGHVNPASTFYYLTAAPELLALAAERLDSTLEGIS
ncbi:MAG: tyrosine-type recombinase/integrase [Actinobacteria bacterium]|nr:tyrosine-type recombinase/integrase [Actinomycetota bacterium]